LNSANGGNRSGIAEGGIVEKRPARNRRTIGSVFIKVKALLFKIHLILMLAAVLLCPRSRVRQVITRPTML